VGVVIIVNYVDDRLPKRIAAEAGAKLLTVSLSVGG
jgi:hypothetical protein